MKKKIAIAVAAVAVVLVGFLFWQTQKTDNTQNNNTNQSDANNLGNISSFSNSELGVKFLYPGDWGEIRLRPLGNSNDKNSVLYGTFESKSSITFKIFPPDIDATQSEVDNPLHYKNWCTRSDGVNIPIPILRDNDCDKYSRPIYDDVSNQELVDNSDSQALVFDSVETYAYSESQRPVIGMLLRSKNISSGATISFVGAKEDKNALLDIASKFITIRSKT